MCLLVCALIDGLTDGQTDRQQKIPCFERDQVHLTFRNQVKLQLRLPNAVFWTQQAPALTCTYLHMNTQCKHAKSKP